MWLYLQESGELWRFDNIFLKQNYFKKIKI